MTDRHWMIYEEEAGVYIVQNTMPRGGGGAGEKNEK